MDALYFSLITMSTVGYGITIIYISIIIGLYIFIKNKGDISPKTYTEKFACLFITIISCGVFAFAMNTMG